MKLGIISYFAANNKNCYVSHMNDYLVLIVIYAALFISSPLIAILHELGHALAYLLLTKPDRVDIYIGSYGNQKNTIRFNSGKLHFYLKRSFPFIKGIGLCHSYKPETNYKSDIIILLAGPVFTFIIACIPGLIVFTTNAHLLIQIACYIFLGISVLSLITNLVPSEIDKNYGINLDNDGKQILFAFKMKRALPYYVEALQSIQKKEYKMALESFKKIDEMAPGNVKILRLLVTTSLTAKQYKDAEFYVAKLENRSELSATDILNKGCLQSLTHQHDEAIQTYSKALKKDRHNVIALNNIASELIEKKAYAVAQKALEKAIKLKPEFDQPYATLAYLKILEGDMKAGKANINICLELNEENADAYKTLGVYYLKLKDVNRASENFDRAIALNNDIDIGIFADELKQLTQQDIT